MYNMKKIVVSFICIFLLLTPLSIGAYIHYQKNEVPFSVSEEKIKVLEELEKEMEEAKQQPTFPRG